MDNRLTMCLACCHIHTFREMCSIMDHLTVAGQLICVGGGCVAETFVAFGFALGERIDFAVICYPRHDVAFVSVCCIRFLSIDEGGTSWNKCVINGGGWLSIFCFSSSVLPKKRPFEYSVLRVSDGSI